MARKKNYEFELDSLNGTWVPVGGTSRSSSGSIYLLVHESDRMVKVGKTKVSAEGRRTNYVRTHRLSGGWKIAGEWQVTDVSGCEKKIHADLKPFKFSGKAKEVFACSEAEATNVIERYV